MNGVVFLCFCFLIILKHNLLVEFRAHAKKQIASLVVNLLHEFETLIKLRSNDFFFPDLRKKHKILLLRSFCIMIISKGGANVMKVANMYFKLKNCQRYMENQLGVKYMWVQFFYKKSVSIFN